MAKEHFMNLPEEYRTKQAHFIILPIAYEGDMTAQGGASKGAQAIIEGSQELEYYDMRFRQEPFLKGIHVLPTLSCAKQDPKTAHESIAQHMSEIRSKYPKAFIITLGGDHSITQGICSGLDAIDPDYSVMMFDAHADLRQSWNGSPYNHACTGYALSKTHELSIIGVRSLDSDEEQYASDQDTISILPAQQTTLDSFEKTLSTLSDTLYLSIDVDSFDPSLIRYTGTPEPGGFGWDQMIQMLETVFQNKIIRGIDIVEFSPRNEFSCYCEQYTLAKLIYHICSLVSMTQQKKP